MTALILTATSGLIAVGGLLWLQSGAGQGWVEARIDQTIAGRLSWNDFRLSPLSGRLELWGLQLHDPDGAPVAGLRHLLLVVSWPTLLQGTLQIDTLEVEAPWADLQVDRDGSLNLARALRPKETDDGAAQAETGGGLPLDIALRLLRLTDGRVAFTSAADPFSVTLADLNLSAEGRWSTRSAVLSVTAGALDIQQPEMQTGLDRLTLEARLEAGALAPLKLTAAAGASHLTLTGSLQNVFSAPQMDLRLDLDLVLAELLAGWPPAPPLAGRLSGRLTARGDLQKPDLDLDLAWKDAVLASCRADAVRFGAKLRDRRVFLQLLALAAGDGRLRIQGEADLQQDMPPEEWHLPGVLEAVSYDLNLESVGLELEKVCPSPGMARGRIDGTLALSGRGLAGKGLSATASLQAEVRDLAAAPETALPCADLSLAAAARLEGRRVTLSRLSATADGVQLQSDGSLDLDSRAVSGNLCLQAPDLGPVLAAFGRTGAGGALAVDGRLTGTLQRPAFTFRAEGEALAFSPLRLGRLGLSAELDPGGMLTIRELSLDNRGTRLRGAGTAGLFDPEGGFSPDLPINLVLNFEDLEPEDFWDRPGSGGRLQGSMRLEGRLGDPRAALSLAGTDVAVENIRLGELEAALRFDAGRLEIQRLAVRNGRSAASVSGSLDLLEVASGRWRENPPLQLTVTADRLQLEDFTPRLTGRVALEARLAGGLRRPLGTVVLRGADLDSGYQKFSELHLDLLLEGERVQLKHLEAAVAEGQTLFARGWLGYDRSYALEIDSDPIALKHIDLLQRHFPAAEGLAALELKGAGTLKAPRLDGELAATAVRIGGSPVQDLRLKLGLAEGLARVSGRLNFDLTASYDVNTQQFDLEAFFQDTAVAPYTRIAGWPDIAGRLSGTLTARGTPQRIAEITAAADISDLSLTYRGTPLVGSEQLRFSISGGQVRVPRNRLRLLADGWLEVRGQGAIQGPLDFEGSGFLPLQGLAPLAADLGAPRGNLKVQGRLGGNPAAPELRLEVILADIGCDLPGLATRLHSVNGTLLLTPESLRIDDLKGMLDNGSFELTGGLDLEAFTPRHVDLRLNAKALPLAVPDTLDLLLNGDLRLSGTPENSSLRGTLTLIEGLYYRDVNLSPLQRLERRPAPAPAPTRSFPYPFLKNLSLDVAVTHRSPFVVDNNLASLEVTPDLRIGGTLERPVMDGRIRVPSGTITYYRRSFTVERGVVDFVSPYRIEPLVEIEATTQVRTWRIRLAVSGPLDNLEFTLTSEPQESDQDILSLLLVGKTSGELISGEGGSNLSPERLMANLVAARLADEVRETTGLDQLEIEAKSEGESGVDAETSIQVTVGKELSRRLMVRYATQSRGGEVVQRAEAEYRLLERFRVTAFQDNLGVFGGALSYRLEFR
ncbi:MAG: translocation/assembly module TamB domain-containing protein [Desulfobacteraceae bacterium]